MGSNGGGKDAMLSGNPEGTSTESTVEIKIKTLDSQTYTLRVDKCVPVPALKEQIAIVTGVLSDQQRLICRGKVLKDDQLLSAYLTDPASSTEHSQANHTGSSVIVGTYNISEQGDGSFPDFGRIVSAVLGSLGIPGAGSGSEVADMHESISERLLRTPGLGGLRNLSGRQADITAMRNQSNPHNATFSLPADVPLETLQPPVIPDSLATLSQYATHMRQEFSSNARGQVFGSQGINGQDSNVASHSGLPTPELLAEVMASARQLLVEQAAECLMQLTRQLEDQATVTDSLARARIQSNSLRSGALLQNLGAFLLELGRTIMTLRMGQTLADAVVNAGPAVFISTSGPNPIMVQPLPFHPGTSFGAPTVGNVQSVPGLSVGSGFPPRNIDIRVRTVDRSSAAVVNQREPTGGENLGQNDQAASVSATTNASQEGAARSLSTRETEVHVVPIRTVVVTIPLGRSPADSSRSSAAVVHPSLARAQHIDSGNSDRTGGQAYNASDLPSAENEPHPIPDFTAQQQNIGIQGATHGQRFSTDVRSGLDQLLRTIFPGERSPGGDFTFQGISTNSALSNPETTQDAANSQETSPRVGDEGTFLANLLRQIIPIVSQSTSEINDSSLREANIGDRNTQSSSSEAHENPERGTSSRRSGDNPSASSSAKRQKRE